MIVLLLSIIFLPFPCANPLPAAVENNLESNMIKSPCTMRDVDSQAWISNSLQPHGEYVLQLRYQFFWLTYVWIALSHLRWA